MNLNAPHTVLVVTRTITVPWLPSPHKRRPGIYHMEGDLRHKQRTSSRNRSKNGLHLFFVEGDTTTAAKTILSSEELVKGVSPAVLDFLSNLTGVEAAEPAPAPTAEEAAAAQAAAEAAAKEAAEAEIAAKEAAEAEAAAKEAAEEPVIVADDLTELPDVGAKTAEVLKELGLDSFAKIAALQPAELAEKIDGISEAGAEDVIVKAMELAEA